MLNHLIEILGSDLDFTATEVAEILWLTQARCQRVAQETEVEPEPSTEETDTKDSPPSPTPPSSSTSPTPEPPPPSPPQPPPVDIYTSTSATPPRSGYLSLSAPDARSLRQPLDFIRALKPLNISVPSLTEEVLNETATVDWIAQTDLWLPLSQPATEPWFDLSLVFDESASMILWRHTLNELQHALKNYGIFRDVRVWGLGLEKQQVYLRSSTRTHSPKELIDPQGRRLILVVSDCVDELWQQGKILPYLSAWTKATPVALLQMLPSWLWSQTALGQSIPAQLQGKTAGTINTNLHATASSFWEAEELKTGVKLPVFTLEPERTKAWSKMLAGQGEQGVPGYVLRPELLVDALEESNPTPQERVNRFALHASPLAQRLAGLLAAAPVITMPVVRLIQDALPGLATSSQNQVAEVFLGGLLEPLAAITPASNPETVPYEFKQGVRTELLRSLPIPDTQKVLDAVSRYVAKRLGKTMREFEVWLRDPESVDTVEDETIKATVKPFAQVAQEILAAQGYKFAETTVTTTAATETISTASTAPDIESFAYDVVTVLIAEPRTYTFEVANVERETNSKQQQRIERRMETWQAELQEYSAHKDDLAKTIEETDDLKFREQLESQLADINRNIEELQEKIRNLELQSQTFTIYRHTETTQGIVEDLGDGVELELVEIPAGKFVMGAPKSESESYDDERPQHLVTIERSFYMGRYPVTQRQWRIVAGWEAVERELENPDPSYHQEDFEQSGDRWQRPVEQISWEDAVEFCARLSRKTGWIYRLPSESEWEYACRAIDGSELPDFPRTQPLNDEESRSAAAERTRQIIETWNQEFRQPFHFGETILPELANYNATETYKGSPKGEYRQQTTPVGYFKAANAFGLYDLHGNVWEWCGDDWEDNYDTPRTQAYHQNPEADRKVIRGGSFSFYPWLCRSAFRRYYYPDFRNYIFGFRVVCVRPRTP